VCDAAAVHVAVCAARARAGDGMVHATRIKGGAASYCNHWVRTHKLAEEQRARFPIYAKVRGVGWGGLLVATVWCTLCCVGICWDSGHTLRRTHCAPHALGDARWAACV
jgi:hypothetical protein